MLPTSSNIYKGTLNTRSKIFWMANVSQLWTLPLDHHATLSNIQLVTFGTRAQQAACRCPTGNWQTTSGQHTKAWDWLIWNMLFVISLPLDSSFCLSPVLLSITVNQNQMLRTGERTRKKNRRQYSENRRRNSCFCTLPYWRMFQFSGCLHNTSLPKIKKLEVCHSINLYLKVYIS